MVTIERGARLTVRSGDVALRLRALRRVDVARSGWAVPVIADAQQLQTAGLPEAAVVELKTETGAVEVEVEMVHTAGDLMLRSRSRQASRAIRAAALSDQRRQDVRGPVRLEFRGMVLATSPVAATGSRRRTPGLLAAAGPGEGAVADLVGATTSISAGGVRVQLEPDVPVPSVGDPLYGEITLPVGDIVPALLTVVEVTESGFRAGFVDISPLDSERLVRLVFHRERSDLRTRSRR